jgi:hypothetical protein
LNNSPEQDHNKKSSLGFPPRTQTRNQDKRQYKSSQPSPLECKQKDYNTQIYTDIATTDLVTKPPKKTIMHPKKTKHANRGRSRTGKKVISGIEIVAKRERERERERARGGGGGAALRELR